jgi:hypothetical protein
MASYLHMRRTEPDPDCNPDLRLNTIAGDDNTRKSGITDAVYIAAKFSAPTVELSWMNVSQARDFRNNRIGGECPRDKVDLFRLAPPTSALRARKYSNLSQRIILAPVQTPVLALVLTLHAAAPRQGDLQRMLTV